MHTDTEVLYKFSSRKLWISEIQSEVQNPSIMAYNSKRNDLDIYLVLRALKKTLDGDDKKRDSLLNQYNFLHMFLLHPEVYQQTVKVMHLEEQWNAECIYEQPTWSNVERCYDLLEEIQNLEVERDAPDLQEDLSWEDAAEAEKKATRFLNWLKKNGSITENIKLQLNEEKNSYEIWTVPAFEANAVVFSIHSRLFLTTDQAINKLQILPMEEQPPEKKLAEALEDQTDRIRLALFLIYEKYVMDKKSFWKPYWDVLPRLSSYLETCTYSKADMDLMKESRAGFRIAWKRARTVMEEYIFIRVYLFPKSRNTVYNKLENVITFRRYLWARVRAESRHLNGSRFSADDGIDINRDFDPAFTGPLLLRMRIEELIPMTDMAPVQEAYIPHTDFATGTNQDTGEKQLYFLTTKPIDSGFKMTLLTKNGSTLCCFRDFGWVPENYPLQSEMYFIDMGLSKFDKLYDRKVKVLSKAEIVYLTSYKVKPDLFMCDIETEVNQLVFDNLFAHIRVIQGNEELLDRAEEEGPEFLKEPDREAWVYLANRFKLLANAAERSVEKVLQKLNIGKDEISKLTNKKHQGIVKYLITEKATLACLAETTAKRIDDED